MNLGTIMFFLLEVGVLSNGQTMQPTYGSASSNNYGNTVNNAVRNSSLTLLKKTTTKKTMKPATKIFTQFEREFTTIMPFLAQKLEASKGTPSFNKNITAGNSKENNDGLPLWAYIVIGVVGMALLTLLLGLAYTKFVKWKDHGTYMVWDDAELETSPAFTRESEFLLETSTVGQEMVSPELQLYEIPLDSVTNPRIAYIGSKRVAPKRMDDKTRRRDGEFNVPSLTRYKKRDTVYNSVTDTCITSVMSEGTLDGNGSTSRHTLANVMLSNSGLDKYGPTSTHGVPRDKSNSMGCRTRSVSNLIQSRPLPAVPIINKRFSKSLDKLRFFNTLPVIKPKSSCKVPLPEPPISHTLVKSASYGSNLQRTVNNNICIDIPPHFATRKSSLDLKTKALPQKSTLSCHRKSKSLDTLMLLKEIDWNAMNVDIYHSYESVHGTRSENGEYASVSDSQPSSPAAHSDNLSQKSPTKSTILQSPGNTNGRESIYASVGMEDFHNQVKQNDTRSIINEGVNVSYDSSTLSSMSSDTTSPYATVRISQIPGLNYDDNHEQIYSTKTPENSGGSLETPENSGSTISEIKPTTHSARSSTHTYLELFPENTNRDSIISETSSGYARPVDVMKDIETIKDLDKESQNQKLSQRQSLSNVEIPTEPAVSFDNEGNDFNSTCGTDPGTNEVYDNPVKVCDDESQKDKDLKLNKPHDYKTPGNGTHTFTDNNERKQDISFLEESDENVHINKWPTLARSYSEHSECEI